LADLKPLTKLEDIAQLLQSRGVRFETGRGALDGLQLGSGLVAQIDKLPPGEIFVLPIGNVLTANKIVEAHVTPVPDADAQKVAARAIKTQQAQDSVKRMFGSVVTHPTIKVAYNPAYAPAPATAAAAPQPAAGGKAG